jgi:hypothetical protein
MLRDPSFRFDDFRFDPVSSKYKHDLSQILTDEQEELIGRSMTNQHNYYEVKKAYDPNHSGGMEGEFTVSKNRLRVKLILSWLGGPFQRLKTYSI